METQVGRWGKSLAVRIPRAFARQVQILEGATVDLTISDGRLIVAPIRGKHDLEQLVAAITPDNRHAETHWAAPVGNEVW